MVTHSGLRYGRWIFIATTALMLIGGMYPSGKLAQAQGPLYIFFDTNSAKLSSKAKAEIKEFAQQLRVDEREDVLVIGHADATGDTVDNLDLSRRRAAAVAAEFIRAATIEPDRVRAVGYGSKAFDHQIKSGADRANCRRAEIHTMAVPSGYPLDLAWIRDHNSIFVYKNLERARRYLFEKKTELALLALKEAEKLGGRSYAQWHLVYGAIGYFDGLNPVRLKSIFQTAVHLDPYNTTARDYYERARAREKFYRGLVRPDMGLNKKSAIQVDTLYEAFEYLRLFNVSPLHRIRGADPHFETWICENDQGARVTYHFRTQSASRWAFAQ